VSQTIIVTTFDDERNAMRALKVLESLGTEKLFELNDAVVLTKDVEGAVSVTETRDVSGGRGAAVGGVAGLVIGALLGGPIGGVLLGAATGAIVSKAVDFGIQDSKIAEVSKAMDRCDSALLLELKSGDPEKLLAAIAETGGELFEINVSDETRQQLEKHLAEASQDADAGEEST
jgi:uncharacterized membrane protein